MSLNSSRLALRSMTRTTWLPRMPIVPHKVTHKVTHRIICLSLCGLMLLVAACSSSTESAATPTPEAELVEANAGVSTTAASAPAATGVGTGIEPYPLDQTTGPVRVQIPEIGLDAPIIAMGWNVAVVDGARTTVWDVPLEEAGWHINSAGAGGLGNTVVSGRQVDGAAVFAPLALGSVAPGQQVLLTDGDGIVFVYEIAEVTDPIPVTGATPDEVARAAAYFAPTETARLTLVTGWPEFTTTHRIFAVADFVGVMR
jgi:sortase (surface protein transpeptidase)